jgi:hypothetical protein
MSKKAYWKRAGPTSKADAIFKKEYYRNASTNCSSNEADFSPN